MIKNFTIYGERDSGTNLLEAILTGKSYFHQKNVPAFDIPVVWNYGWKHWFGHYSKLVEESNDTLFIGIIRNPYDWIMALNKHKHHIPPVNHALINFITKEWYSIDHAKRSPTYGKENHGDRDWDTGKRHKDIFAMRSKKMRYLINTMPNLTDNYVLIKYEDLCIDTAQILSRISHKFKIKFRNGYLQPKPKSPYSVPAQIKKIIDANMDWEIENQAGYKKR
jgi:hypothetical protein